MNKLIVSTLAVALMASALPFPAQAADLEFSGWVPYWAARKGAADAKKHIELLDEVNPFVFTLKSDGTINDAGKMKTSTWKKLIKAAKKEGVRVVPTIMTSDGATVDRILRDPVLRARHIDNIVELVKRGGYDGIDIDYEGKKAETSIYFSLFLSELKEALDDKWLSCSIEPRTPVPDRYTGTPPASAYIFANDYPSIGRACDRVRLMTYDQQTIDQKLNALASGPYIPLADPRWTEKVVNLTDNDIPKDKLVIGVATYGREWDVTVSPTGKYTYQSLWSFNPGYAEDIEDDFNVESSRNAAGEMNISYIPKKSSAPAQRTLIGRAPSGTPDGLKVAYGAREYARTTGVPVTFRYLNWSDAGALAGHIDLAERLGIRGVAIFKIDGAEDKGTWDALSR